MHMHKGFMIEVSKINDREHPYLASCYIGKELVTNKGINREQAIYLIEAIIDFTLSMIKTKGLRNNQ